MKIKELALRKIIQEEIILLKENKISDTENKIRDMFLSNQYLKKIPTQDIDEMLKEPRWIKIAGGKNQLKNIWQNFIDEKYVKLKGSNWVWIG